jgi:hypothetical protein
MGPGGQQLTWDIEAHSLSVLRRTNATSDQLHVGDRVRFAGYASRRVPNRMFGTNLLRADGVELVLGPHIARHWGGKVVGSATTWLDPGSAENAEAGIFRVWSTKLDEPGAFWRKRYPLTRTAQKILAKWDPVHDTVASGCKPKGMPTIMEQPYPMEFVKGQDNILLRMEEYDTVRTIHAGGTIKVDELPKSPLGRSKGHWEGMTLVVTTDGTHLLYSVVIKDPEYLTEPVELKRAWVARPNESVQPYNCGRP